jgi:hypothetical protein
MKTLGIDQSLCGTGLCLLDTDVQEAQPPVLETIDLRKVVGNDRIEAILNRIEQVLDDHDPDLIVMEDYAMSGGIGGRGSNNLTRLAELGGLIKWAIGKRGYAYGYGHARNAIERAAYVENMRTEKKLFVLQTQNQMKKFCLEHGNLKKDRNYLTEVLNRLARSFKDDNQADAYMHAWMAAIVSAVAKGTIEVGSLPEYQQEVLLQPAIKHIKGLSLRKALKMPDEEKRKLVGFS